MMSLAVALIIPALDEETAIGPLLEELRAVPLAQILVVDNGSRDRTAEVAHQHGARVIFEPRRGYGSACLAGIAALDPSIRIVAFMDGDGSDDPAGLPDLLEPIAQNEADFVVGSRLMGSREPGSLSPQQRFASLLFTRMMRLFYRVPYTDLGPFRAIRREALDRLAMRDRNFGWTAEMQIKAARRQLRVLEIPVHYRRRRAGKSKVSRNLGGAASAGIKILWTIFRYAVAG